MDEPPPFSTDALEAAVATLPADYTTVAIRACVCAVTRPTLTAAERCFRVDRCLEIVDRALQREPLFQIREHLAALRAQLEHKEGR